MASSYQAVTKELVIIRDRYYECSYLKRLATQRILPITVTAVLLPAIYEITVCTYYFESFYAYQ